MKKSFILFAAVLLAAGCANEQFRATPSSKNEQTVRVGFCMEADLQTDTSLEPMTRVTNYTNFVSNKCRLLILKKVDTRWIVDSLYSVKIDSEKQFWTELKLTGALPPCAFDLELRPGDYRVVAVLNTDFGNWNQTLKPGTVVSDQSDPGLLTPPLLTYRISDHWANTGYRMLAREIFVAVSDFTVPRSSDLHGTAMPAIALRAERRVGKFRILLKRQLSPNGANYFDTTAHTAEILLTAKEGAFPQGIDALGGMYYGEEKLVELPWCMSTTGQFHTSGDWEYQLCQSNSTVFSPFLFADPAVDELPFEISEIYLSGASGGFTYWTDDTYRRELVVNKICGIVFRTTDATAPNGTQTKIGITEATDQNGVPEDAVALFDPFYEWNASSNNTMQR